MSCWITILGLLVLTLHQRWRVRITCLHEYKGSEFRVQQSTVRYYNPKYISNVSVITVRPSRGAPYMTNFAGTTLAAFDDNLTMIFTILHGHSLNNKNLLVAMPFPICKAMQEKWIAPLMKEFTNIPARCPLLQGTYKLINFRMTSTTFPMPLSLKTFTLAISFQLTRTQEILLDCYAYISS